VGGGGVLNARLLLTLIKNNKIIPGDKKLGLKNHKKLIEKLPVGFVTRPFFTKNT
jgi:hypothetical protein